MLITFWQLVSEVYLPKTFTTRKGALLLFSEDFANKQLSGGQHQLENKQDGNLPELRTVDDLAKSILAYGASKVSAAISAVVSAAVIIILPLIALINCIISTVCTSHWMYCVTLLLLYYVYVHSCVR